MHSHWFQSWVACEPHSAHNNGPQSRLGSEFRRRLIGINPSAKQAEIRALPWSYQARLVNQIGKHDFKTHFIINLPVFCLNCSIFLFACVVTPVLLFCVILGSGGVGDLCFIFSMVASFRFGRLHCDRVMSWNPGRNVTLSLMTKIWRTINIVK